MPFLLGSGLGLRPRGHHAYTPNLSASLVASRSLARATGHTLAATCTASISLARTVTHLVAVTCTAVVTLARQTAHTLVAAISSTVSLARAVAHTLAATLTASSARALQIVHTAAASVPVTATVSKLLLLALTTFTASLSGTGALLRTTGKVFAASCTGTVVLVRSTVRAVTVTCTAVAAVGKDLFLALTAFTASLGLSVALVRRAQKTLSAALTGTVERVQQVAHIVATTMTATVSAGKDLVLAKAAFAPSLPPAPGTLLSSPSQQDTFTRADQSGWGTASGGGAWSATSGAPTVAIASNEGTIVGTALNNTYQMALGTATYTACEVLARVSLQDTNANTGLALTAPGKLIDWYLNFTSTTVRWQFLGSGVSPGNSSTGLGVTTFFWLRLRVQAGVVQARVWQDGTTEPAAWTVTRYGAPTAAWRPQLFQTSPGPTLATTPSQVDSFSVTPLPPLSLGTGKALAVTFTAALSALSHISTKVLAATVQASVALTRTFDFVRSHLAATLTQTTARVRDITKLFSASTPASALALTPALQDTFSRADQSGWGTASDGNTWSGGSSGTYAISGGEGTRTNYTSSSTRFLGSDPASPDLEAVVRFKTSAFGNQTFFDLVLRYANTPSFHFVALRAWSSSAIWALWAQDNSQTPPVDLTTGGSGLLPNTFYWARLRVVRNMAWAKLWADGTGEPAAWGATLTSNTIPQSAGSAGLVLQATSTADTYWVDSFLVTPVQSAVLTRNPAKTLAATITQTVAYVRAIVRSTVAASITGTVAYGKDLAGLARTVFSATLTQTVLLTRTALKALATLLRADPAPLVRQDTFIRADSSSGWGTASDGSTWAAISGTPLPTTWGISGNTGTITGQNSLYGAGLGGSAPCADQSVLVRAQGSAGTFFFVILRHDGANFVGVKVKWSGIPGQSFLGTFDATTGNGPVSGLSAAPVAGTPYWARVQVQGTTLRARVWADGTVEPAAWNTHTISLTAAGTVGLGAQPGTFGVTHTASFDSFSFAQLAAPARAITLARSALGGTLTGAASIGKALGGLARAALGATLPAVPGTLLSVPSQQDTFVRANQSGWGTASDGETWSTPAGFTAPTLAISSNTGSLLATTTNLIYAVQLGSATYTNVEVLVRCALNDTYANAGIYLKVPGRVVQLYLNFAGSTVRWQAPSATAPNDGNTGLGVSTLFWLRLRVQGPLYNARVWPDGTAEPAAWSASGAGLTASAWNVLLFTSAPSSSNPISSASTFDSFSVTPLPPLTRTAAHTLTATVSGSVALGRLYAAVRAFAASLQPSAVALTRTFDFVRSRLASTLTLTTARARAVIKALAASTPASAFALTPTAQDTFVRPDQSGWGTASDGSTWTQQTGGDPTLSLSGNEGLYTGYSNTAFYSLGPALPGLDGEVVTRFALDSLASGNFFFLLLNFTYAGGSVCWLTVNAGGNWQVLAYNGTTSTQLTGSGTVTAGVHWWARLRRQNGVLYGRVWADGSSEPTSWGITVTTNLPSVGGKAGLGFQVRPDTSVDRVDSFSATPLQSALLSRSPAKALAAPLAALAAYGKDLAALARATFASSLGGASTLLRTAGKTLAASMTPLTDLISNFPQVKYFVATCASTAAYTRAIVHTRAVSLVATARLLRTSTRAFATSLFSTATLARRTGHQVQATVTPAFLLLVREARAVLSGTIGATGHITRALTRAVVAGSVTLALGAQLARERVRILAATLQSAGALRRTTGKAVAHTLALTTATRRSVVHVLAARPPLAATLQRATHSTLVAALLGPLGALRRQARPQLHSVVLLASPARLGYAVLHQLRGTLRAPGTLRRALAYGLANDLTLTPRLHRATVLLRVGPAAVLTTSAGLARTAGPVLRAQLTVLARLGHDPAIALRALLPATPHVRRAIASQLAGLLPTQGAGIHFIAPLRVALRAGRWLKGALSIRGQATRVRRTAALEVAMRALATVAHRAGALAVPLRAYTLDGARATRLVARRLASEREDLMIAQPTRADAASLYVAPHEQNVGFTIDMTAALPASTHVASVEVLAVTAKYPGQPEDAAAVVSGFATGPGLASDVITLVVGDGLQTEGLDYEVVLLATYDNDPVTTATIYVEIPCRKGAPQP